MNPKMECFRYYLILITALTALSMAAFEIGNLVGGVEASGTIDRLSKLQEATERGRDKLADIARVATKSYMETYAENQQLKRLNIAMEVTLEKIYEGLGPDRRIP